ncbi:unnamed protein product [Nyctereutes procyonoides]|uniref:(raccoon dog) hypothetical protein n=1 Tax=Nyctereutes procyonoides TaxID=34880 RepID=A0A811Y4B9_NYCPR|nr:unnamed protein product [Nyctereutes procyonoides]
MIIKQPLMMEGMVSSQGQQRPWSTAESPGLGRETLSPTGRSERLMPSTQSHNIAQTATWEQINLYGLSTLEGTVRIWALFPESGKSNIKALADSRSCWSPGGAGDRSTVRPGQPPGQRAERKAVLPPFPLLPPVTHPEAARRTGRGGRRRAAGRSDTCRSPGVSLALPGLRGGRSSSWLRSRCGVAAVPAGWRRASSATCFPSRPQTQVHLLGWQLPRCLRSQIPTLFLFTGDTKASPLHSEKNSQALFPVKPEEASLGQPRGAWGRAPNPGRPTCRGQVCVQPAWASKASWQLL